MIGVSRILTSLRKAIPAETSSKYIVIGNSDGRYTANIYFNTFDAIDNSAHNKVA